MVVQVKSNNSHGYEDEQEDAADEVAFVGVSVAKILVVIDDLDHAKKHDVDDCDAEEQYEQSESHSEEGWLK